jgi:hypothetical protein
LKIYEGKRTPTACSVTVRDGEHGIPRTLDLRLDLRNHSPTGANWGYGGSGPAQLALGIAADLLGDDELAQDVYQDLKWKVIAKLDTDHWTLTERSLRAALVGILKEREPEGPRP